MTKLGLVGFSKNETFVVQHLLSPYKIELVEGEDMVDMMIYKKGSSELSKNSLQTRMESIKSMKPDDNQTSKHFGRAVEIDPDLLGECSKIIEKVMNPHIALRYSIATRLPFAYNLFPSRIRNRFLRKHTVSADLSQHLAVQMARKTLVDELHEKGLQLLRRKPASMLITHDVDTEQGLQRAPALKSVEDDLGIQSIWFLPSNEYSIPKRIAGELKKRSMIGSHDFKHDGKLIHIKQPSDAARRLMESKVKLEEIFEQPVVYFRSPLLQFSRKITSALKQAGYTHDFSVPCWEPIYPSTMNGFGIESAQSFEIDGITETPVTLFQDHQVLYLLGMSVDDAIDLWLEQAKLIRSLDGDIVLLIHPDYEFSRDLAAYRRLLVSLSEAGANYSLLPRGEMVDESETSESVMSG